MLIAALIINAPNEVIEIMKNAAGVTDVRLSELKKQVETI